MRQCARHLHAWSCGSINPWRWHAPAVALTTLPVPLKGGGAGDAKCSAGAGEMLGVDQLTEARWQVACAVYLSWGLQGTWGRARAGWACRAVISGMRGWAWSGVHAMGRQGVDGLRVSGGSARGELLFVDCVCKHAVN